jgi:primosomal protein N'
MNMVRSGRSHVGCPDWLCKHCGSGKVASIPGDCPECGKRLTQPVSVLGEIIVQEDNRFLDAMLPVAPPRGGI